MKMNEDWIPFRDVIFMALHCYVFTGQTSAIINVVSNMYAFFYCDKYVICKQNFIITMLCFNIMSLCFASKQPGFIFIFFKVVL